MTAEQFIAMIRRAANANGGQPPGQRILFQQFGLSRSEMWDAGFARYSDALAAAGFRARRLNPALNREAMLEHLARLTNQLGRFPSKGDIKVARRADRQFPSYEAFFRLSGRAFPSLKATLLEYCAAESKYPAVTKLLRPEVENANKAEAHSTSTTERVSGYVYLVKHGGDFKIGRSNDITRRRRELALILPEELEHVHIIETDDPEGIEAYWHRRFAERRSRGEWFRLTSQDVAAFKRRRYQ